MKKEVVIKKAFFPVFFLCTLVLFVAFCDNSWAQQQREVVVTIDEPQVLAPDSLEERERFQLERQYRYDYRQKDIILGQGVSTPFVDEPTISYIDPETANEEEKIYRYFGIATILREDGQAEEALEIIKFISLKRPDDKFIKSYKRELEEEMGARGSKWQKKTAKDAAILKKKKIKHLVKEGIDCYKQKRFDKALFSFSEVLSLDPENSIGKSYMKKLEEYYYRELGIENIVRSWEADIRGRKFKKDSDRIGELRQKGIDPKVAKATVKLLDKAEHKSRNKYAKNNINIKKLLYEDKLEEVMREKKARTLMDEVELGLKIEEIISERKQNERRKRLYTLGTGDILKVSVQDHPELSGQTAVAPSGDILLPLVNEPVNALGLTIPELAKGVEGVLERYVKDPVVYVGIEQYKSKVFYVIDEQGATPYNITRANFTLRDALFISDWGTNRALGRVLIIKPDKLHPMVKKVDAFDLVYRGNLNQNVRIEDGDVIYVPLTAASKISTTISDALSPISAVRSIRDEWLNQRWNVKDGWMNLPRIPRDSNLQTEYQAQTATGN